MPFSAKENPDSKSDTLSGVRQKGGLRQIPPPQGELERILHHMSCTAIFVPADIEQNMHQLTVFDTEKVVEWSTSLAVPLLYNSFCGKEHVIHYPFRISNLWVLHSLIAPNSN